MNGSFTASTGIYREKIERRAMKMQAEDFAQRFWKRDAFLWNADPKALALGWLDLPEKMQMVLPEIERFNKEVKNAGIKSVILLGMGGSSMAPIVFKQLAISPGEIDFFILDNPDPIEIQKIEAKTDLSHSLFIVSSKSGTTLEVNALFNYFFEKVAAVKQEKAGDNFIAVTDADSPLFSLAAEKKFNKIFLNFSDIGGRFSALSYFGLVPAALMGFNIADLLQRVRLFKKKCSADVPLMENPAIMPGIILGELALMHCDKLTYILPEQLNAFGLWLEQLLAESTGKAEKGILPVYGLPAISPELYGKDRFFLLMDFPDRPLNEFAVKFNELEKKERNPFIHIRLSDPLDLAIEFYRWEIATAVAGALLKINPFDQPNVQESKTYTETLLKRTSHEGRVPEMKPALRENSIVYYAPSKAENSRLLIEKFFSTTQPGSYIGLLTYLPEDTDAYNKLQEIQVHLQEGFRLPVLIQYGPRYLHSTGQYFKGGPKTGYFIQLVYSPAKDILIPGKTYSFGQLKKAQALGDMEALMKHEQKIIQIDLGNNYLSGLNAFKDVIEKITSGILVI